MAAKLDIPLVFYGENPTEYGNKSEDEQSASKDLSYFSCANHDDMFIAGASVGDIKESFGLNDVDLAPFLPPLLEHIKGRNINVQYLGYYLPWHPQKCFYYSVEHGGFKAAPERSAGTYSKYSSIDDKIDDLHYYSTFIKFGIGRATYDASQEVRNGDITREEAVALIKRYDGEYSERFEQENLSFLSLPEKEFPIASKLFEQPVMDREYLDRLIDKFRSPHIWKFESNQWKLRRSVYNQ